MKIFALTVIGHSIVGICLPSCTKNLCLLSESNTFANPASWRKWVLFDVHETYLSHHFPVEIVEYFIFLVETSYNVVDILVIQTWLCRWSFTTTVIDNPEGCSCRILLHDMVWNTVNFFSWFMIGFHLFYKALLFLFCYIFTVLLQPFGLFL